MNAKEMLIEMNCCYMETQSGIWIDENEKKITFQDNENEHKLDLKLFLAIYKLIEELGWNKEG